MADVNRDLNTKTSSTPQTPRLSGFVFMGVFVAGGGRHFESLAESAS